MAILASLSSYYQPKTSRIYVQHIYLELMWPRCWIIRKIELYSILLQDRRQTPQIESLSDSGYNQRMLLRRADGIRSCTSVFPTILFLAIPLLNSCPCTHGSPLSAIFFGRSIVLTEQRATRSPDSSLFPSAYHSNRRRFMLLFPSFAEAPYPLFLNHYLMLFLGGNAVNWRCILLGDGLIYIWE